jgi:hypothetical protein
MREIVSDWVKFCKGKSNFPPNYFYTLLMDYPSIEELEMTFKYFIKSDFLVKRTIQFINSKREKFGRMELGNLLSNDILLKSKFLESIHSDLKINKKAQLTFCESTKELHDYILDDVWQQEFYDVISSKISGTMEFEIYNAVYGLTNDFDLRMHILMPIFQYDYDTSNIFSFKIHGGIFAVLNENEIVFGFK